MDGKEPEELKAFAELLDSQRFSCVVPCALRDCADSWIRLVLATLFPHFSHPETEGLETMARLKIIEVRLQDLLERNMIEPSRAATISQKWIKEVPGIRVKLLQDAEATVQHDPAAEGLDEVISAYPGFYAVSIFRMAAALYQLKVPLIPRLLTEYAHRETGIDIHPGADIGVPFVIDHGTGIVIGQTAEIGSGVKLYQGVTLGALSVKKSAAETKRHPTLEDDVVVYANATILGGRTKIGARSVIAGNAWLTFSVPPDSVASGENDIRPLRRDEPAFFSDEGAYI